MVIKSLGRKTDFIFSEYSGTIEDRGHYILVKTPSNPGFHWGNFIIFDRPPRAGDLKKWKDLFDREFPYYTTDHHYTFTWDIDSNEKGEYKEFIDAGFEFESGVVLTTTELKKPPHLNDKIEIKKVLSDQDWDEALKLQVLCADPKYLNAGYKEFKINQMTQYRKMAENGRGHWFGAYLNNQLVGDLGVFYKDDIARYQAVETHPNYRRQGICGTLVYKAGQIALDEFGVKTLVMEADLNYHAARVYESVGFKRTEINYSLSWWKR